MAAKTPPDWGVDSEAGPLLDVVLCEPKYWKFEDESNAAAIAAKEAGQLPKRSEALSQHRKFVAAFEREGIRIHWLRPKSGQPGQTYTRDSSFMTPWGAVVTLMQSPARRAEFESVINFCHANGVHIWQTVSDGSVEGGDVHVAKPGKVLVGYSGVRTTKQGARQIIRWFKQKRWGGLEIYIEPHFLHLDVLFCMVDHDVAIVCQDVLGPQKVERIVNFLEINKVVDASYSQAMKLLCNVVALGRKKVIIHGDPANASITKKLRSLGYSPIEVDLSAFAYDGGGPHCLAMPYRRQHTVAK